MNDVDPLSWAEAVAKALNVGGERVPFQRVHAPTGEASTPCAAEA